MVIQYKVETRTTLNPLDEIELTGLGGNDWELIQIIQRDMTLIYIFKK